MTDSIITEIWQGEVVNWHATSAWSRKDDPGTCHILSCRIRPSGMANRTACDNFQAFQDPTLAQGHNVTIHPAAR